MDHPSDFSGLLEGWVWKRSRFWKRWRRRWLVLLPEELRSFRSRQAARQRGTQATEVVMKGSVLRVCPGGLRGLGHAGSRGKAVESGPKDGKKLANQGKNRTFQACFRVKKW